MKTATTITNFTTIINFLNNFGFKYNLVDESEQIRVEIPDNNNDYKNSIVIHKNGTIWRDPFPEDNWKVTELEDILCRLSYFFKENYKTRLK